MVIFPPYITTHHYLVRVLVIAKENLPWLMLMHCSVSHLSEPIVVHFHITTPHFLPCFEFASAGTIKYHIVTWTCSLGVLEFRHQRMLGGGWASVGQCQINQRLHTASHITHPGIECTNLVNRKGPQVRACQECSTEERTTNQENEASRRSDVSKPQPINCFTLGFFMEF